MSYLHKNNTLALSIGNYIRRSIKMQAFKETADGKGRAICLLEFYWLWTVWQWSTEYLRVIFLHCTSKFPHYKDASVAKFCDKKVFFVDWLATNAAGSIIYLT